MKGKAGVQLSNSPPRQGFIGRGVQGSANSGGGASSTRRQTVKDGSQWRLDLYCSIVASALGPRGTDTSGLSSKQDLIGFPTTYTVVHHLDSRISEPE